jgi:hypothetical protein
MRANMAARELSGAIISGACEPQVAKIWGFFWPASCLLSYGQEPDKGNAMRFVFPLDREVPYGQIMLKGFSRRGLRRP